MVYITTEVAKTVVSLFTTLPPRTHVTLENQRVSFIFFQNELKKTNRETNTNDKGVVGICVSGFPCMLHHAYLASYSTSSLVEP